MRNFLIVAGFTALFATGGAHAQEGRLQSITVTASMIDRDDLLAAPAIYRRVQADFIQVDVSYQSGTRDAAERKAELATMFERLKAAVSKTQGYALEGGALGESSAPIDTVLFDDIYSAYGAQGSFTLIMSIDTRPGESFDKLMERAGKFVEDIKAAGRTEAFLGDEQYLGARHTDKHREALLNDLQAEVRSLQQVFRASKVSLTGLESRVITQPSGPLELEIFIPYKLTVETGAGE
ncbi:MAG: hypothetical protein VR75_09210 [Hyphomonadaceae bacterium BRH_c29]|nr:MAG: hypothetical protein VR75_09210 [Hyphomonadaceae bacterium BRH_c29]